MRRVLIGLGVVLAVLVLLVGAALVASGPLLNSGVVRERLVEAIGRATGHAARIDGPLELSRWSLRPRARVSGLALLNPPGFAGADFATVGQVQGRVALWPLLLGRVDVRSVRMDHVRVMLERNAAGVGNWQPAARARPSGEAEAPSGGRRAVSVRDVTATDVEVSGLGLPPMRADQARFSPAGGPLSASLMIASVPFDVQGHSGALEAGFPFEARVAEAGLTVTLARSQAGPIEVKAQAERLDAFSTVARRPLPALRGVTVSARIGPNGAEALELDAGAGTIAPGLSVRALKAVEAAWGAPIKVQAEMQYRDLPMAVALAVSPRLDGPVAAQVMADGGTASADGVLEGRRFTGTVAATVPDLRRTGGLAGVSLPPMRDVQVAARVLPAPASPGFVVRGLRVGSAEGDVSGDLQVSLGDRTMVRGTLESERLAFSAERGAAPAAAPAPAMAPAPVPTPAAVPEARPLAGLVAADADLQFRVGQLVAQGVVVGGVEGHATLSGGLLRVQPLRVTGHGGAAEGKLDVDAAGVPAQVELTVVGAGLNAGSFGVEGLVGMVDLDVALRGRGATVRDLAGTLDGHAGLAMVDGEVGNDLLMRLLGGALRAANLPLDAGGASHVRCLAVGAAATGGQVALAPMALDTTRLKMDGTGTMDLVGGTMDLHLRPVLRLGAGGVTVPVRVSGPFGAPKAEADRGAAGRFGIAIGPSGGDVCEPALAALKGAAVK